ncbi:MAG: P-loop NTPase fold protein [Mastigocoleus sp. MO_167.B18]|uniref:P-loop NTPase fold protein n=1 Tax=Mastigocoleus sp. MO_188.B34 TaxID=3036635 RepID=UPI0026101C09|nr:P-loop NTPase fold protein [Mastigocoleus sp. MO_188.B34]MDJ0693129.1 P-loop NTPase fold protein [Mastigocoleus sp. MO_188.B34]MDJ0773032.1 P-loop NTPase fold protein [Mastigocoleus sp. MO_167.B18]
MSPKNISPNNHIKEYLDYYCDLSYSPKLAVLLKGKWGCGKTWFINQYRERLNSQNKKSLYVSLYGVNNYSEIEDSLFQQLHPILASKQMVIAGKVFKGLLKGVLKIDLNNDGENDGTWSVSIPNIEIPKKFEDSNYSLLIFDDLERCNIDIKNILGYINSFVESPELKVVLIANEEEITDDTMYGKSKEKLIGKTFEIIPDFIGTLEDILKQVHNQDVRKFISGNQDLIEAFYKQAECKNLRILNQIILDFERIFEKLPQKAQNKEELLKDILEVLIIFSIEISYGTLQSKDISQIPEKLSKELAHASLKGMELIDCKDKENNAKEEKSFLQIFQKYTKIYDSIFLNGLCPDFSWWEQFFDKGVIDEESLEKLMPNSKYFQDENTPIWIKLWHYKMHTDNEFEGILREVDSKYINRYYKDIGIIKHITGLFLLFSDAGIYQKDKADILNEAKRYIDYLKSKNELDTKYSDNSLGSYMGLGFQAKDFQEFEDFDKYIKDSQEKLRLQNMPNEAQKILDIMNSDISKFRSMICIGYSTNSYKSEDKYYDIPILKYLKPKDFFSAVLTLSNENIYYVFSSLTDRYKYTDIQNRRLVDELNFLKQVQNLLKQKVLQREGRISGYLLSQSNEIHLQTTISHLENIKQSPQQNSTPTNYAKSPDPNTSSTIVGQIEP